MSQLIFGYRFIPGTKINEKLLRELQTIRMDEPASSRYDCIIEFHAKENKVKKNSNLMFITYAACLPKYMLCYATIIVDVLLKMKPYMYELTTNNTSV